MIKNKNLIQELKKNQLEIKKIKHIFQEMNKNQLEIKKNNRLILEKRNKLKQERNLHFHQLQMPLMLRLQECSMRPIIQVIQMKTAQRMTIPVQMTNPEMNNLWLAQISKWHS
ncbi:MAG: hypothetical protein QN835_02265, partial [Nitrososphaeraceae archaeon]|nr:hypothetical protein [Nitrososphaeraceae archaeon]